MRSTERTIRVGLVEDDPSLREEFKALINSTPGLTCVLDASSAEAALLPLEPLQVPEVVLMDIGLPGISGIECIRELKRTYPSIQIMMLTVFEDHERIFQSLEAGASGYLLKHTPPSKLIEAIVDLQKGGSPISAPIARKLVETFQRPFNSVARAQTNEHLSALSPREAQILNLLAKGHLYKEIADELKLSVETIRTHLHNIYEKLHVRSRTEAVMKVYGKIG